MWLREMFQAMCDYPWCTTITMLFILSVAAVLAPTDSK